MSTQYMSNGSLFRGKGKDYFTGTKLKMKNESFSMRNMISCLPLCCELRSVLM